MLQRSNRQARRVGFVLAMVFWIGGCAPLQPPSATGPRGNEPAYPIVFIEDRQRREAAVARLGQLLQPGGSAAPPQLQPITATISALPPNPGSPLYLPKLGTAAVMNEEETRESLRRFIKEWQDVIGADPAKLSLVERTDQADGTKLAVYDHRPFRYPIRGNYGKLSIRFAADRRVLDISSTCIPDADRIQATLAGITAKVKVEDAIIQLRNSPITYRTAGGNPSTFTLPTTDQVTPRGLVTYIRQSDTKPDSLEFHLAWEIELNNAPIKTVFVDAVNGEAIGAQ